MSNETRTRNDNIEQLNSCLEMMMQNIIEQLIRLICRDCMKESRMKSLKERKWTLISPRK